MAPPTRTPRPIVSQFTGRLPVGAAFLASSLAAIVGAAYTLLTTDMPWPDAALAGAGKGTGVFAVVCLAAPLALLVCIPVLPIAIIVRDALLGIADGIRDAFSAGAVDPPFMSETASSAHSKSSRSPKPHTTGIGVEKT